MELTLQGLVILPNRRTGIGTQTFRFQTVSIIYVSQLTYSTHVLLLLHLSVVTFMHLSWHVNYSVTLLKTHKDTLP